MRDKKKYTADFETTTDIEDCRVWASGICEIGKPDKFYYGNNIEHFIDFCKDHIGSTFYFQNLKFDGEFIFNYLFRNGYSYNHKRKSEINTFKTLISDMGQFYSIEICFRCGGVVKILDGLKILPFSIETMAKCFGLDILKGSIDYHKFRPIGHKLDRDEISYLKNDVEIPARSLDILFKQKLTKMTQGSNALSDYKKTISSKNFARWFPPPVYDSEIRQSYKGGFTYVNPDIKGMEIGEGIVLDVNSLYPSVMYYNLLPYGEGAYYKGKYKNDKIYPLYVQTFTCNFELKKGYLPTIQIKQDKRFVSTDYISSSNGDDITLCLTNVDLELFFEHYDVYNIEYHSGWKFMASDSMFREYIDKWNTIKVQATIEGNEGMRTLAKLMLNALYGKFALNPRVQGKYPYFDDGIVKYSLSEEEERTPIYIPMGTFITSYARNKTIRSAQKVKDRFLYADTDSLHLSGKEIPDLEISSTDLGKWKIENYFERAKFIRQKCYIEEFEINEKEKKKLLDNGTPDNLISENNDKVMFMKITCAGMPSRCYPYVTWDNFKHQSVFEGKLRQVHAKGGIVLKDVAFTIKL